MAALQPPAIVIPGITATSLEDFYPLETEEVWASAGARQHERIALHPADVRYEAQEPARVLPRAPFGLVYNDLIEALRHELTVKKDRPTPVFGFGYDWRQDGTRTAEQLGAFIDEVLARTSLVPHYAESEAPVEEVDLVGHSMGGLIIARYLGLRQEQRRPTRVRRVVTIGAPFRGSVDAIHKLTTGMGFLTGYDPRDREREAARTIPALYQLLPTFAGAVKAEPGLPSDIFKVDAWQPSLLATLKEYLRFKRYKKVEAEALLQGLLSAARSFITAVNQVQPKTVLPEGADGWLAIAGIDHETHVDARIAKWKGDPWFELTPAVNAGVTKDETGDGTVPFLGALPDFLERERLVCVTDDDLSFWELRDRALVAFVGLHGFLPKVNLVQKLSIRWLKDDFRTDPLRVRRAPGAGTRRWPRPWLKEKA